MAAREIDVAQPPVLGLSPAADLQAAFWRLKKSRVRVSNALSTRASSIGEPCERKLFYYRTAGELATPHPPELQAIFDLGKELEEFVLSELRHMGADVVQRERDHLDRELEFSAHSDARIVMPGWPRPLTAEVKGLNPYTAESIETIEDIRTSRQAWVRKYYDQLQSYLYFDRSDLGVFVLLNKVSGQITFVDCPRDQKRIDEILAKAARIRDAARANVPPERRASDECTRCPFQHVCVPDRLAPGPGVQIMDSEEVQELIALRLENAEAHAAFEAADRALKKKLPQAEEVVVGDFLVRGSWCERGAFTVKPTKFLKREYLRITDGGTH
jgi:hypothetical protein